MEPSAGPPEEAARFDRILIGVAGVALVLLAGRVLLPLFAPLIFAAWTASILAPLAARVTRLARGRAAVGAAVSVLLVLSLFVPVGLVLVSLGTSVVAFVRQVSASPAVHSALVSLVSSEGASEASWTSPARLVELARTHGMTAWQAARGVAGAGAWAVIVAIIYFITLFELLVSGPRHVALGDRAPAAAPAHHGPARGRVSRDGARAHRGRRPDRARAGRARHRGVRGARRAQGRGARRHHLRGRVRARRGHRRGVGAGRGGARAAGRAHARDHLGPGRRARRELDRQPGAAALAALGRQARSARLSAVARGLRGPRGVRAHRPRGRPAVAAHDPRGARHRA
jgi:hypothetical protein